MKSPNHQKHLDTRVIHNDCRECRADNERRFVRLEQWHYDHVHDYLSWCAPRMEATIGALGRTRLVRSIPDIGPLTPNCL
jgi:hypothetical protein